MLFMTEEVYEGFWILKELTAAVNKHTGVMLVRETDKRHGAVALSKLMELQVGAPSVPAHGRKNSTGH
jgi:hypothetical protein